MFNPKKSFSFLKTIFEVIVAFHIVAYIFELLHEVLDLHEPAKLWAWSFALWASATYLFFTLCFWRYSLYQDRIEECAKAKAKLEMQVLKNRQSSSNKSIVKRRHS